MLDQVQAEADRFQIAALQAKQQDQEQLLMLVNGTISLNGVIHLSGEDCSLFSEAFVLCPNHSGQYQIQHQIFKVHKPNLQLEEGL